jgi:hypothetical protein
MPHKPIKGEWGWLILLAFVAIWDYNSIKGRTETLSTAYWHAVQSPLRKWPTIVMWAYLTAHLFHLIPDRWDPLRRWG